MRKSLSPEGYAEKKRKEAEARITDKENSKGIIRKERLSIMLSDEIPSYKSIGSGINDGVSYTGVKLFENGDYFDAVVCSDRSVYVAWSREENEIKDRFRLNYRFPLFHELLDYSWSNRGEFGVRAWLEDNDKKVSLKDAYEKILELVEWKYWNPEPDVYKHHALSILSTFFLTCFEAIGREVIYGERGWGKSRLSNIYVLLSFNPVSSGDFSDASIYRSIESLSPTISIDNFDSLPEEQKRRILHIFNIGYLAKAKAIRSEGKTFKPTGFREFSKLILNSIDQIGETPESRANITRNLKIEKAQYEKLEEKDPRWTLSRDMNYFCGLQNWKEVQKSYQELQVDRLFARELERVAPNLALAKLIDIKLYETMLRFYRKDNERRKLKDLKGDWIYLAMEEVVRRLAQDKQVELKVKDVVDALVPTLFNPNSKDYERRVHSLSIKLGSTFANVSLFPVRASGGYAFYTFSRENVIQFCKAKDFGEDIVEGIRQDKISNKDPTDTTEPTNPTHPTDPTHPTSSGKTHEDFDSFGQTGEWPDERGR